MQEGEKPDALAEIEDALAWIAGAGLGHSMLKMSERAKRCLSLLPRLREVVDAAKNTTFEGDYPASVTWREWRDRLVRALAALEKGGPDGA